MVKAIVAQNPDEALEFTLLIEHPSINENTAVRAKLVDADKFFMPSYTGFSFLPIVSRGSNWLKVTLQLPQLLKQVNATNLNSRVLEFSIVTNGAEDFIGCGEEFKEIVVKTNFLKYRLCLGSGKNLVLRLEWNKLTLGCSMKQEKNLVITELAAPESGELALRHRMSYEIISYDRETRYKAEQPGRYVISCQDLIDQIGTDRDLFSLFFRVAENQNEPIYYYRLVSEDPVSRLNHPPYIISICQTKDKTACLEVRRILPQARLTAVTRSDSSLNFEFEGIKPDALKLRRIVNMPNEDANAPHTFVYDNAHIVQGNTLYLLDWNNINQQLSIEYQLLIEANGIEYLAVSDTPYEESIQLAHQNAEISGTEKGVFLKISQREKKIRLGILGTCMTRWAFSSKYSPAYHSLYDVTFAHFWPSVFSLMEKPIDFPESNYYSYSQREQRFVRREYEKTSLQELKEADCEYILIDFFVDAVHGPRKMKDGKFIGYKAYANDFYQDYLMFDSDKFFIETNDYFEQWKQSADRLIEMLETIVPQHRIVLATGGLTHYYLSAENKLECFDGIMLRNSYMTRHSINALNYLWDKMNTYFMAKMPGAHILSMREYDFPAHDRNPDNVRPYHFVKAYYRAMSAEMSRVILWDKQNQ